MPMTVRPYRDADWSEWLRLSRALFPDAPAEEHATDMRTWRGRPDAEVFVVERPDGTLAGYVEVGSRPYADGCATSPVGYVEAWYVDPDARRAGHGRALLAAAERWARARGYTEMASDTQLDNAVSQQAHARAGYAEVDRVVQFRKALDDAAPGDAPSRRDGAVRAAGAASRDAAAIVVRRLGPGDGPVLARVAPDVFDDAVHPRWSAEFLADPRHHLAVALDDDVVVGIASAVHYVHPDKPPELWVNEVGVAPTHQGMGVGTRLLHALFAHGRALGCAEAWVLTSPANGAARRLYAGAGGEESGEGVVMFTFRLGGGPKP